MSYNIVPANKTYKHKSFKNKIKKQNNKKSKRRKSILYKGAGNKYNACEKYRQNKSMRVSVGSPIAIASEKTINQTYEKDYKLILESLQEYDKNRFSFLILKLGSNDSSEAISQGSAGTNGDLFWETQPLPSGRQATELIDMKTSNLLHRQFKRLDEISENKCKLLAISPVAEYENYQYPFINNNDDTLLSMIRENIIKETKYIQSYFPIGVNSDIDSYNYKLLQYLSERPGPLLIFNAMGSWCYSSIKYILDMRKHNGFSDHTAYAGLVDSKNDASCEIGILIYPDPDKSCSKE
jgi:hypothetical protein